MKASKNNTHFYKTEKVILNNVSISSEKEIMVIDNP